MTAAFLPVGPWLMRRIRGLVCSLRPGVRRHPYGGATSPPHRRDVSGFVEEPPHSGRVRTSGASSLGVSLTWAGHMECKLRGNLYRNRSRHIPGWHTIDAIARANPAREGRRTSGRAPPCAASAARSTVRVRPPTRAGAMVEGAGLCRSASVPTKKGSVSCPSM